MADYTLRVFYYSGTVQATKPLGPVFPVPECPSSLALPVDMHLSFRAPLNGSSHDRNDLSRSRELLTHLTICPERLCEGRDEAFVLYQLLQPVRILGFPVFGE